MHIKPSRRLEREPRTCRNRRGRDGRLLLIPAPTNDRIPARSDSLKPTVEVIAVGLLPTGLARLRLKSMERFQSGYQITLYP